MTARTRHRLLGALAFAVVVGAGQPAAAETPWISLRTRAELGNQPRLSFSDLSLGVLGLAQTQATGRLPLVELAIGQSLAETLDVTLSESLRQDIEQPLANAELYQAYQSRVAWRQAGGVGLNPLYVAQIEDAYVVMRDPGRNGQIQVGQFLIPFGHDRYSSVSPPIAIAPIETPMSEYLTSLGPGAYQSSTLTRWRDIGALISGTAGSFPYAAGVFNGSGPNRLDDNGAKDWFARLDWRSSETDLIGVSALLGEDFVFPMGFSSSGVQVDRRRYGIHWRFQAANVTVRGEWAREERLKLDPSPRDGYVLEAAQPLGTHDLFYATYSQYVDPNARPGRGYTVREAALGDVRTLLPGVSLRLEALYRWEESGSHRDDYGRYLTSVEVALGGPPSGGSGFTVPRGGSAP